VSLQRPAGRVGVLLLALFAVAATHAAPALLDAPFTDHMVVQRDRPIAVWGAAAPGARVDLQLARHAQRVRADRSGRWQATLPALPAGGPHVLNVASQGRQQRVDDVLIGDVWLCSGQSNMALPVERTLDARAELAAATHGRIRLLQIPTQDSAVPTQRFADVPQWQPATPDTVRGFSATCYYFARELQRDVDVPMGLINASWNGSRIEAWTRADALRRVDGQAPALAVLDQYAQDPAAALVAWSAQWQQAWQRDSADVRQPWRVDEAGPWQSASASAAWVVPALADHLGMGWYRTMLQLDAAQAGQPSVLELGRIDELDTTWINGRIVGSSFGAGLARRYVLPAGTLHAGENTLVVNVLNTYREGGLPAEPRALRLADGSRLPLAGPWDYQTVPAAQRMPPTAPWLSSWGMGTLHNGMVAPLAGYGLRGALWYQGESNTFEAGAYAAKLAAYRTSLRTSFGSTLPLLVVQLAGFGPAPLQPEASDWAQLREAQRRVVAADPHAALVVALDIGEHDDLHPANKQAVGQRLARAALHLAYADPAPASGPVPVQARRDGNGVRVAFADIESGLVAHGGLSPVGFELCGDTQASCRYAQAHIDGNDVVLEADGAGQATRVRYGWAGSPVITLYDRNGLPAGPFELPIR
jgi:sialate O-acetylesterase